MKPNPKPPKPAGGLERCEEAEADVREVRDVSPRKHMMLLSFRIPKHIAYDEHAAATNASLFTEAAALQIQSQTPQCVGSNNASSSIRSSSSSSSRSSKDNANANDNDNAKINLNGTSSKANSDRHNYGTSNGQPAAKRSRLEK